MPQTFIAITNDFDQPVALTRSRRRAAVIAEDLRAEGVQTSLIEHDVECSPRAAERAGALHTVIDGNGAIAHATIDRNDAVATARIFNELEALNARAGSGNPDEYSTSVAEVL